MGQKNAKKQKTEKRTLEERRKRKLDDENFVFVSNISHSNSASLLVVISASISAKELTNSRYFGVQSPNGRLSLRRHQQCPNCGDTPIPP